MIYGIVDPDTKEWTTGMSGRPQSNVVTQEKTLTDGRRKVDEMSPR
jgi:hypothetical protein